MSIEYVVEFASKKDIKQINEIVNHYVETSGANWSWESRSLQSAQCWFKSHDFNIHPIFVAKTAGGKVLGYAALSPFRAKKGYWPVAENSIYVAIDYHGLKIGYELMNALLDHAYLSSLEVVTAWIDSENVYSIDFHKKWKFEIAGQMKNIGDKWGKRRSVTILQLDVQ